MRTLLTALTMTAVLISAGALCAAGVGGGLTPAPAINIPYGGKIVTDINLSDKDVLGIIKQALPAVGEAAKQIVASGETGPVRPGTQSGAARIAALSLVDWKGFVEAISGIKNIRFIIASYSVGIAPSTMLDQLNAGVAKMGRFSKIISDAAFTPGLAAVYAQENNAGYVGFMYDPKGHVVYGARVVGFVDVPKLVGWAMNMAKLLGKEDVMPTDNATPPDPLLAPESAPMKKGSN